MPVCPNTACSCGHPPLTAEQLQAHISKSPWSSRYCGSCKSLCGSEAKYLKHVQTIHSGKVPALNFSAAETRSPGVAQRSLTPSNQQNSSYCTLCRRVCASPAALRQHYRDMPAHPKCRWCGLGFLDRTQLEQHIQSVHKPITCPHCDNLEVLKEDIAAHRVQMNHIRCNLCSADFANPQEFEEHTLAAHPAWRCAICDTPYSTEALLEEHYLSSSDHKQCNDCRLGFADILSWESHTKAKHSVRYCSACNECFDSASLLRAHYDKSPEHPKCPECDAGFADTQALREHVDFEESDVASFISRTTEATKITIAPALSVRPSVHASPVLQSDMLSPPPPLSLQAEKYEATSHFELDDHSPLSSEASLVSLIAQSAANQAFASAESIQVEHFHVPGTLEASIQPAAAYLRPSQMVQSISEPAVTTTVPIAGTHEEPTVISTEVNVSTEMRRMEQHEIPIPSPHIEQHIRPASSASSASATSLFTASHLPSPFQPAATLMLKGVISPDLSPAHPADEPLRPSSTLSNRAHESILEQPQPRIVARIAEGSPGSAYRSLAPTPDALPSASAHIYPSYQQPIGRPRMPSVAYAAPGIGSRRVESRRGTPQNTQPSRQAGHSPSVPQENEDKMHRVSYIYCRKCRRDPARQPTATMCGHIFCYGCISREVLYCSQCPVCEVPLALYSLIKLQVA